MPVWARNNTGGESLALTVGSGADDDCSFVYLIIQTPEGEYLSEVLIEDLSEAEKLQIDVAVAVAGLKGRLQRR